MGNTREWHIGIDIAKAKVDVAGWNGTNYRHHTFGQTGAGHAALVSWLGQLSGRVVAICMEATGTYGDALAEVIHCAGYRLSVLNPAILKAFRQSTLTRTKNDRTDAVLLAHYGAVHQPAVWSPPAPEMGELQALARRLDAVREMRQQEVNRQENERSQMVTTSITTLLAAFDDEIARLEQRLQEHIEQHPEVKAQHTLLQTIKGVGEKTATGILAECGDLRRFASAREVAAFAGLTPKEHRSGSSVHGKTRISKTGSARLRKLLYFPAVSAQRYNPIIKPFCQRLHERGKHAMAIICAAMRKLLHLAYGVIKSGKPFDPQYGSVLPQTA